MILGREEGKIYWLKEFERKASEVKEVYKASGWRTPNSLRARMKVVKRLLSHVSTFLRQIGVPSSVILDLGCGPGSYLPLISEFADTVVALDLSPKMASRARETWPKALVCVGDAEQLPFRDSVFHIIVCVGLLQYLDGAEKALSEMARVTKEDGAIIIITLNSEFKLGRPADISRTYSLDEIRCQLDRLGMKIWEHGFLVIAPFLFSFTSTSRLFSRLSVCIYLLATKAGGQEPGR